MGRLTAGEQTLLRELQTAAVELIEAQRRSLPPVTVRLSARLTRSAGIYRAPGDIAISRHYLAEHGLAAALAVLRHELAHHIVRWTAREERPHGPAFKATAAALAAPLRAEAFAAPYTVYAYRCPACGWTWQRRRRIRRGARYACARCSPRYSERFRLQFAGAARVSPGCPGTGDIQLR